MKKILISISLLVSVAEAWAVDTYNPANGQLTIPTVVVGDIAYSDVIVNVVNVLSVGSAPANGVIDFYNSSSGLLTIPSVQVENVNYYNAVVSVGGVVSVGSSSQPTSKLNLNQVRSWAYVIATGDINQKANINAIANTPIDLIIANGMINSIPFNRKQLDPSGTKLIFAYVNPTEAAEWSYPSLFVNNTVPNWFGGVIQGYSGLYSVQYWNSLWQIQVFNNIDKIIDQGFDGIFLDCLDEDAHWLMGNKLGNQINDNATSELANFLTNIRKHIDSKYPDKKILLMGNTPVNIGRQFPSVLLNLDAAMNEWVYWGQSSTNGLISEYKGTGVAGYIQSLFPMYLQAKIKIFGNDYPPLSNQKDIFPSFDFYNSLGWLPSINQPYQTIDVLSNGPYMFVANTSFPVLVGKLKSTNFLSGGNIDSAVLIGGNMGDYFIAGPGKNVIQAGSGNDTIYAHSINSTVNKKLTITYKATNISSSVPNMTILVNGDTVLKNSILNTSIDGSLLSSVSVDLASYSIIDSIKIIGTNMSQTGTGYPNQWSNFKITEVNYENQLITLGNGVWTNNVHSIGLFNNNDTVTFSALNLKSNNILPRNTASIIDGGGGINTVIYRANRSNYTVIKKSDGSFIVTSALTPEGPDTLTNIQVLKFADQSMNLN